MFTIDDLLEIAIKMEENGEAIYLDSIDKFNEQKLKETMQWMAKEEAAHARWFETFRKTMSIPIEESDLKEMAPGILQQMMGDNTLSLDEIDFSSMKTIEELFQTFIGFEQDTIDFYEVLKQFIDDETVLTGLDTIIQEEKSHIKSLESKIALFKGELVKSD